MHNEILKEITDFPGYYVSDKGTVYSNKSGELTPLAPGRTGKGYLKVMLCKGPKQYCKKIHRLVAEAFIPNPDNLPQVNHLDENKYNNSVENLEWSSLGDNVRYSLCKPVIDLTTKAIYPSASDASRALRAPSTSAVGSSLYSYDGWYKGHQFMFLLPATKESVNTIEIYGKKYEIPEIIEVESLFDGYDLFND